MLTRLIILVALPYYKPGFSIWEQVCHEIGCELWVNVENFERVKLATPQDFIPADFKRLATQLSNAVKF
jgi:hypothetical protein